MTKKREFDQLIKDSAAKHLPMIDARFWWAQIRQESQFNPIAVSDAGAVGLAQIMPSTWAEWSKKSGYQNSDATNPEGSVFTGAMYMRYQWEQWTAPRPEMDRLCLAWASYNAGLGNILDAQEAAKGVNDYKSIIASLPGITGYKNAHETQTYVRRILGYFAEEVTG